METTRHSASKSQMDPSDLQFWPEKGQDYFLEIRRVAL